MANWLTSLRLTALVLCAAMISISFLSFQYVSGQAEELDEFQRQNAQQISLEQNLSKWPGGFAWDYLQDDAYPNLLVEVDMFKTPYSIKPNDYFGVFKEIIASECEKDDVRFVFENSLATGMIFPELGEESYSMEDVTELARQSSDYEKGGDTCVIHVLIMSGTYERNSRIVGLALDAKTFVIFPSSMEPWAAAIIVAHELGHLLGLVGTLGLDSPYCSPNANTHYDIVNTKHCTDARCMMNFTVASFDSYCDECREDLAWIRQSKCPYTINESPPEIDWTPFGVSFTLTVNFLVLGYTAFVAKDQSMMSQTKKAIGSSRKLSGSLLQQGRELFVSTKELSDESLQFVLEPSTMTKGRISRLTLGLAIIMIMVTLSLAYYIQ